MDAPENLPEEKPFESPDEKLPTPQTTPRRNQILFAAGFLGWYLVNGLIWFLLVDRQFSVGYGLTYNLFLFPANLIVLLFLGIIRSTKPIGMGILTALAANLVIATFLGVGMNGLCFIPFFFRE